MEVRTIIEFLDDKSVSIVKKNVIKDGEKEYYVGDPHRCSYLNDEQGRELLREEVPNPYYSAIIEIWGDHPTVIDEPDREIVTI